MCGDSASIDAVEKLMDGEKATLIHADPPYGMGKEKDGVLNDNLYREKLDAFQMAWWKAFRPFAENNASAYIWGNAPDLWRLWYRGGLEDSERLTFRNDILWEQEGVSWGKDGMSNLRQYATMGEHCLFFMMGEQGFNNNTDNYWQGFESIRSWLVSEKEKSGLSNKKIKEITNTSHTHYWTKSQWAFPTEEHYNAIKKAAENKAFAKEYEVLKKEFYSTRAYFNSGHDKMRDVWRFDRVKGEERHGHATPKPVQMMERVMKSSAPENAIVVEPFLGSGSTLIACEKLNRKCYGMELDPKYCDVIITRWQDYTGRQAIHAESGELWQSV